VGTSNYINSAIVQMLLIQYLQFVAFLTGGGRLTLVHLRFARWRHSFVFFPSFVRRCGLFSYNIILCTFLLLSLVHIGFARWRHSFVFLSFFVRRCSLFSYNISFLHFSLIDFSASSIRQVAPLVCFFFFFCA